MKTFNLTCMVVIAMLIVACSSTPMAPAPVVERSVNVSVSSATAVASGANTSAARPPQTVQPPALSTTNVIQPKPVVIVDGKTHTVKKGDTLYSIALENGVAYRDLADWNGVTNPSYIQIDQVLRLSAPAVIASATQSAPVTAAGPAPASAAVPVPLVPLVPSVKPPQATPTATVVASAAPVGEIVWQWPTKGKTMTQFVEGKSKGIDISGSIGEPILAAADGTVVYGGSALKGYGQMLIIKHNDVFLTAYAHNSKLLVKEDQVVKRGQKIAEMGNTESDNGQTKLHFELRRSGKPVDPVKLLPAQ